MARAPGCDFRRGWNLLIICALPLPRIPNALVLTTIMVTIHLTYTGDLRTNAIHGPSGTAIQTDAPTDNQGKGEFFSPTDLCATALGSCVITTLGIKALQKGWDLTGSTVTVEKIMSTDTPRRIGRLNVDVNIPDRFSDQDKKHMVNIAHACPVHRSLHPDIHLNVNLHWV